MSIAQDQIQNEIPPKPTPAEPTVLMKRCCECNQIKPITEYNPTLTGKRHQPYCKTCQTILNNPRQPARIIGRAKGKPILATSDYKEKGELYDNFSENFNKLKEMGDTWLRDEILRKNYGEVKPVKQNTYKQVTGKCKVCNGEIDKELLHHGLCPNCWTLKKKLLVEDRLKKVLEIIEKLTQTTGREWFTAPSLAKYQHKTYEWAYSNLVRMEEFGMVISQKDDGRKYWKVIKDA